MKYLLLTLMVLSTFLLCTPSIGVTIRTLPEGASVFCDDKYFGEAPVDLCYKYGDTDFVSSNMLRLSPMKLKWISGAILVDTPIIDISNNDDDVILTFWRPDGVPNLEADVIFGKNRETNEQTDISTSAAVNHSIPHATSTQNQKTNINSTSIVAPESNFNKANNQIKSSSGNSYNCKECNSDFDCGFGNKCVKAEGDLNFKGCCIQPVNQYGVQDFKNATPSTKYGPQEVDGCNFNTDCPFGFECVKRPGQLNGICVKK